MRPPYLTVRLPSLPRFLPSSGVKSSSGIARRPSLANQARERRISAIPTPLVSRPRPGIPQNKDVQPEPYVALRPEERRVGKEWFRTCEHRGAPNHKTKTTQS